MAIKPNELRLGNWVKWDNADNYFQIESVNENSGDEIDPIPLTPKILNNLGYGTETFKVYAKHWFGKDYKELCRYVHQLQNVHFIATGVELNTDKLWQ